MNVDTWTTLGADQESLHSENVNVVTLGINKYQLCLIHCMVKGPHLLRSRIVRIPTQLPRPRWADFGGRVRSELAET